MLVWQFVFLLVAVPTLAPIRWHYSVHSSFNLIQAVLCFFCALNAVICVWEISLWRNIALIEKQLKQKTERFKLNRTAACLEFLCRRISVSDGFSVRYWAEIWSTYAMYDPSYADKRSYGFFIDVGNGHTMLIPSILWIYGMTAGGPLSPFTMGVMGIISFYQMFYGTVLYFLSFFVNARHHGKTFLEVFLFVGLTNGIWLICPLLGIWASVHLVAGSGFSIFI